MTTTAPAEANHAHPSLRETLSHQPKAVWVTAFAAVIAFMGIGLVDPILESIAKGLDATPSQTTLLFSSYLGVQVVAMLFIGWFTSMFGAKRTVIAGLLLIVIASGACALAGSIGELVAWRAVWGLGNALFIATALAVIVSAATGGQQGAILLYEAALGVGLAVGPLLGAVLGGISWRGPFAGTATLMLIGAILCATMLKPDAAEARAKREREGTVSPMAPLRALRQRGLFLTGLGSAFYTAAFFTVLAWSPFVLHKSPYFVGAVFVGWGLLVAVSGVWLAPKVAASLGERTGAIVAVITYGVLLAIAAVGHENVGVVVAVVVLSGIPSGVLNTLFTGTAMSIADAPRPVASAGYNFLRWAGGAIAATGVAHVAQWFGTPAAPFFVGAAACVVAAAILTQVRDSQADTHEVPAEAALVGDQEF
ncbi:Major facilitator superfamily MFS_1 OS=Tsukamurella paurometabola (strain ATCC 8368 / DSM /CCUG 35730 / CIP 100753 / JCM 10117 / KCTC 9821 / NBRC 16120/ NCIMB 702349 / NCTC 13040) OX=521096 GN=Tpau_4204 PE=4 SV=1 [Tsukamurella paurometabola]|uniref:Major facilitator superfamily MFS_1 n=1 Tax=Tsukamurella paurometabola (strain ATCC 8368 / DSM 20162 / CCUG 35730 / CIP 100753 / JCM 10117 / KCTC 9821 / NBRC 16120 / NCIMB 702349 / NCTC 13040) TaxID=521096 RepID=D5UP63_TSUPD|nr:MFS transporter [Tsukamurella paurometabola]ADG80772.1 major facilitator superfamily MFS_1 [Tsukamurella paurometabola DSM 20162]SUP40925.1 High-copy suppressor of rspA [Tsukamurella paurometabola]